MGQVAAWGEEQLVGAQVIMTGRQRFLCQLGKTARLAVVVSGLERWKDFMVTLGLVLPSPSDIPEHYSGAPEASPPISVRIFSKNI